MTDHTLLFVGGPIDGRRQRVPADLNHIVISEMPPPTFSPEPVPTYIYKKYVIRFEGGDVPIAVIEYMTPLQAFIMMCDKYPPQFGADLNAG